MIPTLLTFLATFLADFAWAKYMLGVADRRPLASGLWSAGIILLSAISVVSYTTNHWMILPAAAGAFAGTWLAVAREAD